MEGPEVGVYYRGKHEITNGSNVEIELPDYVDTLATNFTVYLTPIYNGEETIPHFAASDVKDGKFKVHGSSNGKFNWIVYGLRTSLVVEPNKDDVYIQGSGPYKWYEMK